MFDTVLKSKIQQLLHEKNLKEARDLCITLCAENPNDVEAHLLMGSICGQTGNFIAAENALIKAFSISPEDVLVNFNLGLSYYHQKKFESAVEYLARAAQLDLHRFDVWFYLGMSCQGMGNNENAIVSFERALNINSGSIEVLSEISKLYLKSKRWPLAVEALERLFNLQPDDADILLSFCDVLCRACQYERLLKNIEPVALNRPADCVSNYYVAQAYFE